MKTDTKIQFRAAFAALLIGAVAAAPCVIPVTSRGQIFVANYESTTIGEYNATTGATINSSFISALSAPAGIVLSGGDLFVTNSNNNTIGEYNATTGATINSSLVSGLTGPEGIVVSSPVPEPTSITLLLLGMTAIFGLRFFARRSA